MATMHHSAGVLAEYPTVVLPLARFAHSGPFHRLQAVRRQEEISLRTVARRLGISETEVKLQECETSDIRLSVLYKWAEALGVPVVELVQEPGDGLSLPLLKRARLLRLMKTVQAILEQANQAAVKRLAQRLVDQLTEIMPELGEVKPWNAGGKHRRRDDYGRTFVNRLSEKLFVDSADDYP